MSKFIKNTLFGMAIILITLTSLGGTVSFVWALVLSFKESTHWWQWIFIIFLSPFLPYVWAIYFWFTDSFTNWFTMVVLGSTIAPIFTKILKEIIREIEYRERL